MENQVEVIKEPFDLGVAKTVQTRNSLSPEVLISMAIEKGLPVETLERLLAMRKELKEEVAKEAFEEAMANFQAECPVIDKEKDGGKTQSGTVAYKYASFGSIIEQVQSLLGKHGFNYSFETETKEAIIKVVCVATHKQGYSKSNTMEIPLGTKTAIMSAPQVVAATVTYAKRYAFMNVFGITTADEDTDRPPMKEDNKATPEQLNQIMTLGGSAGMTLAAITTRCRELYGVSYVDVTQVQALGIIAGLQKKINEMKAAGTIV